MPALPHEIRGTVYDENSIVKEGVTVSVTDLRLNQGLTKETDPSGNYIIDLANLPDDYADKDVLSVQAYINEPPEKYANATLTLDTGVDFQVQNLTLKVVVPIINIKSDKTVDELTKMSYEPAARAIRFVPTTPDGTTYYLMAKKDGDNWILVLPDGTQFGAVVVRGNVANLQINGEFEEGTSF